MNVGFKLPFMAALAAGALVDRVPPSVPDAGYEKPSVSAMRNSSGASQPPAFKTQP